MEPKVRAIPQRLRWLAVAAVISVVAAACSPAGQATQAPTAAPTQAPTEGPTAAPATGTPVASTDVTFITDFLLWGWHSPYFAGVAENVFAGEGLNVTIQAGSGSVNTATQLGAGNVDFGLIDISTALKAMSEGAEFKLIGVQIRSNTGNGGGGATTVGSVQDMRMK